MGLLRREVRDLALDLLRPRDGQPRGRAGHAEVGEAGAAVGADEDVLRRAVAVDQAEGLALGVGELVRRVEAGERVEQDAERDRRREQGATLERAHREPGERVALDELHHQKVAGLAHPHLEDGDHVRVVDARGEPRFVEEHLDELLLAREVRVELLDGDEAREAARPREPAEEDGRHPARRNLADELVRIEPAALVVGLEHADAGRPGEALGVDPRRSGRARDRGFGGRARRCAELCPHRDRLVVGGRAAPRAAATPRYALRRAFCSRPEPSWSSAAPATAVARASGCSGARWAW